MTSAPPAREPLDPAGDLAAVVADLGGEPREGQQRMAAAVAETLAAGSHLLVQAGTGTGKSVGYLVPALAHAVERGQRVVISTATLALQRQVISVDAPRVADVIQRRHGRRPDVALLKGWQNYLCRHKIDGGYPEDDDPGLFAALVPPAATGVDLAEAAKPPGEGAGALTVPAAPAAGAAEPGPSRLAADVLRLRAWAEETDTGDRDDLVPGVTERAWRQVSVSKLECLGARCPVRTECFAEAARAAAGDADVVVTNHAMLGIAAAGSPGVLPEHDVLVVDEAHDLADRVTSAGTLEISGATVRRAARLLAQAGVENTALATAAQALTGRLELTEEGRLPEGLPAGLRDAIVLVEAAAREAVSALKPGTEGATGGTGGGAGGSAPDAAGGTRAVARAAIVTLHEACERLLSDSVAQRRDVLWCAHPRWEGGGRDVPPRLHLAPLDVAGPIGTGLLTGRAVVATSATLALGGGFEPMARSLGMTLSEEPWEGIDVGSPFDHARQGILYVARHLPPAGRDGTAPELLDELTELVRSAGGRTLGLFSSRRAAEAAAAHLRAHLDTPVLCQGEDQLPTLVRAFAADEATTLVGTLSLWQGVDVPGPTCRLVVIDRIPFPRPDDPIRSARTEAVARAGGNGFMSVAATHAALLLAQGAGRLLRRGDDRGVVAILDPRLVTARYGTFLLRSLPGFWRTTDRDVVLGALRRLGDGDG